MSALATIRSALALLLLSAIAVTLSVSAITAQAATVASTAHYQKEIDLNCSSNNCSGNFPAVADRRRLNVTRMSCVLGTSGDSPLALGEAILMNASNGIVVRESLADILSSSTGYLSLNQAIDIQAAATQHIRVDLSLAGGTALSGFCTATGTLDTLR